MLKKINWPAILWAIFILIICGIPGYKFPSVKGIGELVIDKFVHIIVFGVLSFLWIRKTNTSVAFIILLCALYGALIEILQVYVFINRSGEVLDLVVDIIGAIFGVFIYSKLKKAI